MEGFALYSLNIIMPDANQVLYIYKTWLANQNFKLFIKLMVIIVIAKNLSGDKKMLISPVIPMMSLYCLPHGQYSYSGYIINLPQDVKFLCSHCQDIHLIFSDR